MAFVIYMCCCLNSVEFQSDGSEVGFLIIFCSIIFVERYKRFNFAN